MEGVCSLAQPWITKPITEEKRRSMKVLRRVGQFPTILDCTNLRQVFKEVY